MNLNLTMAFQVLFFAVFVWFSKKFVWAPIIGALIERKNQIADGLAAAEKGLKEMIRAGKDKFVITVLKKAKEFNHLVDLIKDNFIVENIENDQHDLIYFCKRLNS